jgi:alkylation response protein AidB-like acyl-CoA dehydrogenase
MTILFEEEYADTSPVVAAPDVVAKAGALRLTLRERATETDRLAKLPESTVADLEAARLFEITTPRLYGGLQLDVRTFMDAMVALGRAMRRFRGRPRW